MNFAVVNRLIRALTGIRLRVHRKPINLERIIYPRLLQCCATKIRFSHTLRFARSFSLFSFPSIVHQSAIPGQTIAERDWRKFPEHPPGNILRSVYLTYIQLNFSLAIISVSPSAIDPYRVIGASRLSASLKGRTLSRYWEALFPLRHNKFRACTFPVFRPGPIFNFIAGVLCDVFLCSHKLD